MSVSVRIKQKSLFKKKLNIEEIIKLTNLSYGVSDENYRIIPNEIAEHTLIYDNNRLARGIDISLDDTDVVLLLSLPTSPSEIRKFYEVIEIICNKFNTQNYIREEELVNIKDNEKFIKYDEEGSIAGLEDLQEKISHDEYKRFEIFGVYNPISIGINEIKKINNNLYNLEEYLDKIQSLDVYYATPRVYRVKEKLIGIYAIGPNIPSVVPTKPYIVLNQIKGIEEWYVMMKEGKTIKYNDLINNAKNKEYYDANHIIVTLSDNEIDNLLEKYIAVI